MGTVKIKLDEGQMGHLSTQFTKALDKAIQERDQVRAEINQLRQELIDEMADHNTIMANLGEQINELRTALEQILALDVPPDAIKIATAALE